ncbi:two-component system sensor histidine kinase AlgZ [Luteibacter sp. Sphag1AF]|uniref:sensor histidine kinase n=1 Tax=Luteibacter sp. Sphag1AF TaxID=2587031 RepID=UPI00161409B9|nr:histidine kinase [Luteibacter sp. Sphag1AF]MBB3227706.1 two-component system sensor histidine kinase AlgZ [Luteibacter sp. Sphag1AF]
MNTRTASRPHIPFALPLLAGLPIVLCMAVMGLPELSFPHAGQYRALYATCYLLWSVPLTAIQRALWRRVSPWTLATAMLVVTYIFSVINNSLGWMMAAHWRVATAFSWTRIFQGLDGCWLALIAFCAIHAVVSYYYELRTTEQRLRDAQNLARDAQLRALRYQLHPHFLYNTLNAISSLVLEHRNDDAARMLSSLGDLLRATLDSGDTHSVTLAEELSITQLYLDIEKARLGDRLVVDIRVGPDVLAARVPFLLLQPLMENAVRHGIAMRRTTGHIHLDIARAGDTLRVTLTNDGIEEAGRESERPGAIGLRNVRDRLATLYGDEQSVNVDIAPSGSCVVTVTFPLQSGPPLKVMD